jgi:hypothetical protein
VINIIMWIRDTGCYTVEASHPKQIELCPCFDLETDQSTAAALKRRRRWRWRGGDDDGAGEVVHDSGNRPGGSNGSRVTADNEPPADGERRQTRWQQLKGGDGPGGGGTASRDGSGGAQDEIRSCSKEETTRWWVKTDSDEVQDRSGE